MTADTWNYTTNTFRQVHAGDNRVLILVAILLLHWILDFVCQNDWMALGKSRAWRPLLLHTLIYSLPFALTFGWRFGYLTFAAHTVTDYWTSRVNAAIYQQHDEARPSDGPWGGALGSWRHWFFVAIGFDQWLHHAQLVLTWWWLS